MCSLGHHDHADDVRPPRRRRHLDNSMSQVVAATPRRALAEARKRKHAQLAAELRGEASAPGTFQAEFYDRFEPLPPGADQLPDHLIALSEEDKASRRRSRSEAFRATGDL